ncbi:DCC1-like thiol-disulfide oxidoreductase family protein [Haloarcula litorea]|nr:DCC1-like thiol-disulfide oxidoreductase family protein [Halomicroarcula sp. GDY20]
MFVNYVADDERSSPINYAAARLVLAVWLVWKTVWYDWPRHVSVPFRAMAGESYAWALPVGAPWLLTVEQWLLVGLLLLFAVGYRTRATGFASAALLAHLGVVRATLNNSGETKSLFLGSFVLLFFALYADDDALSVDGLRRTADWSIETLVERLKSDAGGRYRLRGLTYSLLLLAVLFFSTAVSKVVAGDGLGFVAPDNLTRLVLVRSYVYPWYDAQLLLVEYPVLGTLGGVGTLVVEMGLLVAVLLGITVTPVVFGLATFTLSNVVLLGIFFVDNLFLLALFTAFDRVHARLALDRDLDLVFDERCRFCVRALYPFKLVDVAGSVTFYSQSDVPARYGDREDVDFGTAMYVFDDGTAHEGYDAFRELCRQYRTFLPLVGVMGLPPVRAVGRRIYRYVAANRSRHFTCDPDSAG